MKKRLRFIKRTSLILLTILVLYIGLIVLGYRREETAAVIGTRSKTVALYSLKGTIYDKDLNALTNNSRCYYLLIDPRGFLMENVDKLSKLCAPKVVNPSGKTMLERYGLPTNAPISIFVMVLGNS